MNQSPPRVTVPLTVESTRDHEPMFDTAPEGPSGVERRFGLAGVLGALGVAAAPVRCGKFELRRKLGEGAMGVVYLAHDAELGRDVALKLLRASESPRGYAALRREARALARLNHANVVQVLAVGESEGRTWIAMEYIEGGTLAGWSESNPPAGSERFQTALRLLLAAGRGLAAAHGAGLVHRDFKPANVLVAPGEQAKVADFGLARAEDGEAEPWAATREALQLAATLDSASRTGLIVGTPLYMAPELHYGSRADFASDQFAFAVSAWQVLHGVVPFVGRTRQALVDALEDGRPGPLPRGTYTVAAVTAALRRAMSPDPAARYPSMEALLDALCTRSHARWWGLGALGLAAIGYASMAGASKPDGCGPAVAANELERVWNASRSANLEASMLATKSSYASTTWTTVEDAVDRFGVRWTEQRMGACAVSEDVDAQREQDARLWCLRGQLEEVDALLQRLERADAVEGAVSLADQIPRPVVCRQPGEIESEHSSPLARDLQAKLAAAAAANAAGEYEEATRTALEVMDRAREAGLQSVAGAAAYEAGSAMQEIEDPQAIPLLESSYETALSLGHWAAAAERARRLVVGSEVRHELDQAWTWLRHAKAALQRAPDPVLESRILRAECGILDEERKFAEALTVCERSLALLEGTDAPQRMRTQALSLIATLHGRLGHSETSLEMLTQLRQEALDRWGPNHPRVGGMALNLGSTAQDAGQFELAAKSYREAAEVFAVAYGPHHGWVASAYINLSSLYVDMEEFEQAAAAVDAGLEVLGDREDDRTARLLHNLASVRRHQKRYEEALELLLRVAAIETKVLSLDHPQTAHTHHTLGLLYMNLQRYEDAQRELDRSLELRSRGSDPFLEADLRWSLASLADNRGQPEKALVHIEFAIAGYESLDPPPPEFGPVVAFAAALHAKAGDDAAAKARLAKAEAFIPADDESGQEALERARIALSESKER